MKMAVRNVLVVFIATVKVEHPLQGHAVPDISVTPKDCLDPKVT